MGENGSSRNFRIVNDVPLVVTSVPRVSWRRDPSGRVASSMGVPVEMCLPERCASVTASEFSISASNMMLVLTFRNFLWYRKIGILFPSQEMSSR